MILKRIGHSLKKPYMASILTEKCSHIIWIFQYLHADHKDLLG